MHVLRVALVHIIFYILVLVYLLAAALVIDKIERTYRTPEQNPDTLTFHASFLLVFEVVSTIGYGSECPKTTPGKVCCIFIALFGIPLWLLAVADIGRYLSNLLLFIFRAIRQRISRAIATSPNHIHSQDAAPSARFPMWFVTLLFSAYVLVIARAMSPTQNGYFEDVYYMIISVATIGFGDYYPSAKLPKTMYANVLAVAVGIVLASLFIGCFVDLFRKFHNFGIRAKNCRNLVVWLGRRKTTLGRFSQKLLKRAGISQSRIDDIVDSIDDVANTSDDNECNEVYNSMVKLTGSQASIKYALVSGDENDNQNIHGIREPPTILVDIGTEMDVSSAAVSTASCQTTSAKSHPFSVQVKPQSADASVAARSTCSDVCSQSCIIVQEVKESQTLAADVSSTDTQTDIRQAQVRSEASSRQGRPSSALSALAGPPSAPSAPAASSAPTSTRGLSASRSRSRGARAGRLAESSATPRYPMAAAPPSTSSPGRSPIGARGGAAARRGRAPARRARRP